jgi:hypothetical protein
VHHPTGHLRAAHRATVQRLLSARNDYWPGKMRAVMPDTGWLEWERSCRRQSG